MTSLTRELGAEQDLAEFGSTLARRFAAACDWDPEERDLEVLDQLAGRAAATARVT
jgi:hypothetical protein